MQRRQLSGRRTRAVRRGRSLRVRRDNLAVIGRPASSSCQTLPFQSLPGLQSRQAWSPPLLGFNCTHSNSQTAVKDPAHKASHMIRIIIVIFFAFASAGCQAEGGTQGLFRVLKQARKWKKVCSLHMQEAPERKGLVQQLQFWRKEGSSRGSEPDEAPVPDQAHAANPTPEPAPKAAPIALPAPKQTARDQDGVLDDVDSLMAKLAEQQVSTMATQWTLHKYPIILLLCPSDRKWLKARLSPSSCCLSTASGRKLVKPSTRVLMSLLAWCRSMRPSRVMWMTAMWKASCMHWATPALHPKVTP